MVRILLKRVGITLSQFALDLNISRPTLDTYIENYMSTNKISNAFYNDIFDFLFSDPRITDEEFMKRYMYMKDYYGISNNQSNIIVSKLKSGFYQGDDETLITSKFHELINNEVSNGVFTSKKYDQMLLVLKNYDEEFEKIIDFTLRLKGIIKNENLNNEKIQFYSFLFHAYKLNNDKNSLYDVKDFEEFCMTADKAFENKNNSNQNNKSDLINKINKMIKDELENTQFNKSIDEIIELIKDKL